MEGPAAMLAQVELSLLVDGLAAEGFLLLVHKYNKFPLKERQSKGTYR